MSIVVIPEAPADEWDYTAWRERMAAQKPGGPGVYSLQTSEETLSVDIPDNQRRSALRQILGWSWADDAAPWRLHRPSVGVQHPVIPWLWADSVSWQPYNPLAKLQADLTARAKVESVGFPDYSPDYAGRYSRAEATVRFKPVFWKQYRDDDLEWSEGYAGKEWMRSFGVVNKAHQLDLISAEGANDDSQLEWAEGGPDGPGQVPFGGTQFVRASRTTFKMVWKNVPINYTCGEQVFNTSEIASFLMPLPRRLVRALGTVNSVPFPGDNSPFLAGTLLLTGVEESPYQQPVRTDSEFGLWAADYVLTWEYFNPPRDPASTQRFATTGPAPVKYGHHLFPYRPTRYWYLATAGTDTTRGTYDGKTVLEEIDHHDLFRHVNDPDYPIP